VARHAGSGYVVEVLDVGALSYCVGWNDEYWWCTNVHPASKEQAASFDRRRRPAPFPWPAGGCARAGSLGETRAGVAGSAGEAGWAKADDALEPWAQMMRGASGSFPARVATLIDECKAAYEALPVEEKKTAITRPGFRQRFALRPGELNGVAGALAWDGAELPVVWPSQRLQEALSGEEGTFPYFRCVRCSLLLSIFFLSLANIICFPLFTPSTGRTAKGAARIWAAEQAQLLEERGRARTDEEPVRYAPLSTVLDADGSCAAFGAFCPHEVHPVEGDTPASLAARQHACRAPTLALDGTTARAQFFDDQFFNKSGGASVRLAAARQNATASPYSQQSNRATFCCDEEARRHVAEYRDGVPVGTQPASLRAIYNGFGRRLEEQSTRPMLLSLAVDMLTLWRSSWTKLTPQSRALPPNSLQLLYSSKVKGTHLGSHRDNYVSADFHECVRGTTHDDPAVAGAAPPSGRGQLENSQAYGSNVLVYTVTHAAATKYELRAPAAARPLAPRKQYPKLDHSELYTAKLDTGKLTILHPKDDLVCTHSSAFDADETEEEGWRVGYALRWLTTFVPFCDDPEERWRIARTERVDGIVTAREERAKLKKHNKRKRR
jgi:hypothetical protein